MRQNTQAITLKKMLIGNRVPKEFFITSGIGESNITIHAGSYHLALKNAGIEQCNIMTYSSILPAIAQRIDKESVDLVHGSVMETIMAVAHAKKGQRATAGIIFGWLYDKKTGEKHGGIVSEYNGALEETRAIETLHASLKEIYENGFSESFELKDIEIYTKSFVPDKEYGTALIALCFTNYEVPVEE